MVHVVAMHERPSAVLAGLVEFDDIVLLRRLPRGRVKEVDFNWSWGFKVGIGYNMMKHDEWDSQLYYTWFHTSKKQRAGIESTVQIPNAAGALVSAGIDSLYTFPQSIGAVGNTTVFKSGEIDWNIRYNMFDWELGRNFYVSKHLALRPHVGIKGGWINQHINGHFDSFADLRRTYHMDNDFWGVGPSGGVNTKWNLGNVNTHFFSLFGDFASAYMWGCTHVKFDQNDPTFHDRELTSLGKNLGATMLQAFMGFGWDTNFHRDMCHFSMRLGYEYQQWFNQLQLFSLLDYHRDNYDLTLQGGTLEIRFDF